MDYRGFQIRDKDWCNCVHAQELREAIDDIRTELTHGNTHAALDIARAILRCDKDAGNRYAENILGEALRQLKGAI